MLRRFTFYCSSYGEQRSFAQRVDENAEYRYYDIYNVTKVLHIQLIKN